MMWHERLLSCNNLQFLVRQQVPYFPDYKPRLFFKNFRLAAYIPGATYVRTFPKKHALHTARYGVHRSALDQDQLTHSSTVLHNHWLSLQPCSHPSPARRVSLSLSLSVYAWTRPSTARTGRAWENARLMSRAEHAALAPRRTPDFDPHTSHNWPTSWGTRPMSWLGIKLLHHRRLSPTLLSPRVEFSGPRPSRLAALLPIFSSRVCIRGRSYVQGNNRRGCD